MMWMSPPPNVTRSFSELQVGLKRKEWHLSKRLIHRTWQRHIIYASSHNDGSASRFNTTPSGQHKPPGSGLAKVLTIRSLGK